MKIHLGVILNSNPIVLHDSTYQINNGYVVKFETFKFYISNIQLLHNNVPVFTEQNSFHLIDASDTTTQNVFLKLPNVINFNTIKFNLGIDSITNVSGAMVGDLDPTKGMYWTWQSGYINFKMEGNCSNGTFSKNDFQFHLGGYQYAFNPLQQIVLNTDSKSEINIILDINQFFNIIDLSKQKKIMSPCAEAVILSQQLAKCFSIK